MPGFCRTVHALSSDTAPLLMPGSSWCFQIDCTGIHGALVEAVILIRDSDAGGISILGGSSKLSTTWAHPCPHAHPTPTQGTHVLAEEGVAGSAQSVLLLIYFDHLLLSFRARRKAMSREQGLGGDSPRPP